MYFRTKLCLLKEVIKELIGAENQPILSTIFNLEREVREIEKKRRIKVCDFGCFFIPID